MQEIHNEEVYVGILKGRPIFEYYTRLNTEETDEELENSRKILNDEFISGGPFTFILTKYLEITGMETCIQHTVAYDRSDKMLYWKKWGIDAAGNSVFKNTALYAEDAIVHNGFVITINEDKKDTSGQQIKVYDSNQKMKGEYWDNDGSPYKQQIFIPLQGDNVRRSRLLLLRVLEEGCLLYEFNVDETKLRFICTLPRFKIFINYVHVVKEPGKESTLVFCKDEKDEPFILFLK